MKRKLAAAVLVLAMFVLSSCVIRVVDRPNYYQDYDDKAAAADQVNYNAYYGANYAVAVPTATPVSQAVNVYFILKVVDNAYYFYEADKEVAVWRFNADGTIVKKGKVINGLVKRFYDGTNVVESEIPYKNGERWGICKKFYPNGLLKEYIGYSNGERHGQYKVYYPNGKVLEEGNYQKGNRYGNYKKYMDTGDIEERGSYSNGRQKVTYRKVLPTPTPAPTRVNNYNRFKNENGDLQDPTENTRETYRENREYEERMVITVVVTPTPVKDRNNRVIINRDVPPVVITVVVTETPSANEDKAGDDTDETRNGYGKPGWVKEKKEVLDERHDQKKEEKQEMKEDKKDEKDGDGGEVKDREENKSKYEKKIKSRNSKYGSGKKESVTNTAEDEDDDDSGDNDEDDEKKNKSKIKQWQGKDKNRDE